eukprot:TRINITY_DN16854_c0_g1_i1.p1 TRINITY_DN16854_c0_g1~~TRINITY_DN16854_c0_g1_i1.p1  ORF type:complete len:780 (+),score=212.12 TRINITY_DN16854_c0_g1_i1:65-2341(+)
MADASQVLSDGPPAVMSGLAQEVVVRDDDEIGRLLTGTWHSARCGQLEIVRAEIEGTEGFLVMWGDIADPEKLAAPLTPAEGDGQLASQWWTAQGDTCALWVLPDEIAGQLIFMAKDGSERVREGTMYRKGEEDLTAPRRQAVPDFETHCFDASGLSRLQAWYRGPLSSLPPEDLRVLLGTWEQRVFSRKMLKRSEYKISHRGYSDFLLSFKGSVMSGSMLFIVVFVTIWSTILAVLYSQLDIKPLKGAHEKAAIFIGFVLVMFNTQGYERHQHALRELSEVHAAVKHIVVSLSGMTPVTAGGGEARAAQLEVLRFIPALLAAIRHTLCNHALEHDDTGRALTPFVVDEIARFLTAEELRWVVGKGRLPHEPLRVVPEYWARCRTYGPGWTAWDLSTGDWMGPSALCPLKDRAPQSLGEDALPPGERCQMVPPPTPASERRKKRAALAESKRGACGPSDLPPGFHEWTPAALQVSPLGIHAAAAAPAPRQVGGGLFPPPALQAAEPKHAAEPWMTISACTRGLFWLSAPREPTEAATAVPEDSASEDEDMYSSSVHYSSRRPTEQESAFSVPVSDEPEVTLPGVSADTSEIRNTPVRIIFLLQRAAVGSAGGHLNKAIDDLQRSAQQMQIVADTKFPLPWTHSIPVMVFLWVLTLPLELLGYSEPWYAVVVTVFFAVLLIGLYQVAKDLSDPFGFDLNDIDMVRFEGEIIQLILTMFPELQVQRLRESQNKAGAGKFWNDRWARASGTEDDKFAAPSE